MGRFSKTAVALLAVLGVLVVLITPAMDELPSTAPHSLHHTIALSVTSIVFLPKILLHERIDGTTLARLLSGTDLISLICTRLC
jgi:hypothetical protein